MIIFKISPTLNRDMEAWFWILGWSLCVLTIFGNGFIIFLVGSKRHLRTKTNAFVVSLAVADFLVGLSAVPSLFFCKMAHWCNLPHAWLSWVHVIRWLFSYASVTNLCSLVLDRYIAIVKPLKYLNFMTRRHVIQIISLCWAVPVVIHILPAASIVFSISVLFPIFLWVVMVVFEFLPCVMLIFCFVSMLRVIWKHDRAACTFAKQLSFNHRVVFKAHERSAVKMMAVVINLFLLCYALHLRCSFLSVLNVQNLCNDIEYKVPMLVLNSAVNPVAYAFFKRDIKKDIIKSLMYCASFKRPN